jgi:hypothetical protein
VCFLLLPEHLFPVSAGAGDMVKRLFNAPPHKTLVMTSCSVRVNRPTMAEDEVENKIVAAGCITASISGVHPRSSDRNGSKVTWRKERLTGNKQRTNRGKRFDQHQSLREINDIAKRETTFIRRWKWLMTVVLLTGSSLVSIGAFVLISREEEANYNEAVC